MDTAELKKGYRKVVKYYNEQKKVEKCFAFLPAD